MRGRPSVLVIDDDEFLLKGLDFALDKLGLEAKLVANAKDFVAESSRRRYDVHLIDQHLAHGVSGFDLLAEARKRLGAGTRIIMISSQGPPLAVRNALELGADDFILKPLDREHLAAKLSRYVSTPEIAAMTADLQSGQPRRYPGTLDLAARVTGVDHLGIRLRLDHFVPVGTRLKLTGGIVREVAAAGSEGLGLDSCTLRIADSWTEEEDDGAPKFSVYGVIERGKDKEVNWRWALRRWLLSRKQGPA